MFLGLTAACAPSENHNATSNNNATPATANTPPVTAQPATPMAEAAPPVATVPAAPPAPTSKLTPGAAANPGAKPAEAKVEGPKLVVVSQDKDLDFGKQPQDAKLVRPIRIKNGGTQTLNIESVSPG